MSTSRRPTSVDVARLSGVSQPMVSYVLNNTPGKKVAEGTRQRVLAVAAELGFTPSKAAQNLARGKSSVVVLDAPPGPDSTMAPMFFTALSTQLERAGWMLVSHYAANDQDLEHLHRLVHATQAEAVLAGHPDDGRYDDLRRRGIAIYPLLADNDASNIALPVHHQLTHLTSLGHTHIAFVAPNAEEEKFAVEQRWDSACSWLKDNQLPAPARLNWSGNLETLQSDLLEVMTAGVTAIAAHNDATAMPVLAAAYSLSIPVPARLAVIGMDDTPQAKVTAPPLSTVRYVFDEQSMGHLAQRIVHSLSGSHSVTQPPLAVHVQVIRRAST